MTVMQFLVISKYQSEVSLHLEFKFKMGLKKAGHAEGAIYWPGAKRTSLLARLSQSTPQLSPDLRKLTVWQQVVAILHIARRPFTQNTEQ